MSEVPKALRERWLVSVFLVFVLAPVKFDTLSWDGKSRWSGEHSVEQQRGSSVQGLQTAPTSRFRIELS